MPLCHDRRSSIMAPDLSQPSTSSSVFQKLKLPSLSSLWKSKTPSSQDPQGSLHPNTQSRSTKSRHSLGSRPEMEQQSDRSPKRSWTKLTPRSSNRTFGPEFSLSSIPFGSPPEPEHRRDAEVRTKETEADNTDETKLRTGRDAPMPEFGANNQLGPKNTQKDQPVTENEGEDLLILIHGDLQEGNSLDGGGIRPFLPEGLLVEYLTEESVRKKLEEEDPSASDVDDLVAFIVHHARKIFATLVLSGFEESKLCKAIRDFRNHKIGTNASPITDDFLPITETKKKEVPFFNSFQRRGHWNVVKVTEFCVKQWTFLAPVLPPPERDGVPLLKADALTILPFTEAQLVDAGAFGEVYKVMLCPSNMLTEHLKNSYIAVKRLKDPNPEDEQSQRNPGQQWTREVETHAEIQRTNHPHIIDFIAAIERGRARYLLFSWADQGNLQSLWEKHKSPLLSSTLVEDVIRQLQGLADALHELHNCGEKGKDADSSWRHGDVKPQNILSRSKQKVNASTQQPGSDDQLDIGHLMMSDLGLAKHHSVATKVRNDRTSTRSTTFRYSPPEVYTLEETESTARSRRYDIWSMGCVILEFSIWLLYGWHALDDFNKKIITADWGEQCPWFTATIKPGKGKTAKLHGIVEHTINFILKEDPECRDQTALRELIELVRDKLLVVELGSPKPSPKIPSSCSGTSDTTPNPSIQEQVHVPTIQVPASEEDKVDDSSTTKVRAESKDVNDALQQIIKKGQQNKKYWFTGKDRTGVRLDMIRIMTAAGWGYLSPEAAAKSRAIGRPAYSGVEGTPSLGVLDSGSPNSSTMTAILQVGIHPVALDDRTCQYANLYNEEECLLSLFWTPEYFS